jgi:hypothetical protein
MNTNIVTNKSLTDRPHPESDYHASPSRSILACGGTIEFEVPREEQFRRMQLFCLVQSIELNADIDHIQTPVDPRKEAI